MAIINKNSANDTKDMTSILAKQIKEANKELTMMERWSKVNGAKSTDVDLLDMAGQMNTNPSEEAISEAIAKAEAKIPSAFKEGALKSLNTEGSIKFGDKIIDTSSPSILTNIGLSEDDKISAKLPSDNIPSDIRQISKSSTIGKLYDTSGEDAPSNLSGIVSSLYGDIEQPANSDDIQKSHGPASVSTKGKDKPKKELNEGYYYEIDEAMRTNTLSTMVESVKINKFGKIGSNEEAMNVMYYNYNKNHIINPGIYNSFRKAHVFMTIPSCRIFDTGGDEIVVSESIKKGDIELYDFIMNGNEELARFLDREAFPANSEKPMFMFPLMNLIKNISPLPSYEMKTRESPKNLRGNYAEMAVDTTQSLSANVLNITFEDDRYATVSRLLYMWMRYMESCSLGLITPREDEATKYGYIDYDTSVYTFITDETNQNIIYWFKWTSLFPKERNYSHLNVSPIIKDRGEITVPFKIVIPADFSMHALLEFNYLSTMVRHHRWSPPIYTDYDRLKYKDMSNLTASDHYPNNFFIEMGIDGVDGDKADIVKEIKYNGKNKLLMYNYDKTQELEDMKASNIKIFDAAKLVHKKVTYTW